jgi:hypothetical protein
MIRFNLIGSCSSSLKPEFIPPVLVIAKSGSDETIQLPRKPLLDCFATLAMTTAAMRRQSAAMILCQLSFIR